MIPTTKIEDMEVLNLGESTRHAIHVAQSLAKERRQPRYGAAHLLCGLLNRETGVKPFLLSIGKDPDYLREWAEVRLESLEGGGLLYGDPVAAPEVSQIMEEADNVRVRMGLDLITPLCVLTALSKPNIGFPASQMQSYPLKERELLDAFLGDSRLQESLGGGNRADAASHSDTAGLFNAAAGAASRDALARFCIDRTAMAREGRLDPVIGRDKELRMMMEILSRRTKPNVLITGDAGVGKTALVDGLALSLVSGDVPTSLEGALLMELDTGSLIAGAGYKGEIEDRLKSILKALKGETRILLFIDELHSLLDPKGAIGSSAGNLLKPELARGEITVIGATTQDEYRKIIEPEQAFSRRFEIVAVKEPDIDTAIRMLECQQERYETHHRLGVEPGVLEDCVKLSKRYLQDRRLPDAAFDLLDRTMAAVRMVEDTGEKELDALQQRLEEVKAQAAGPAAPETASAVDALLSWIRELHDKISPVLLGSLELVRPEESDSPDVLLKYAETVTAQLRLTAKQRPGSVTRQDIAAVISFKTGIPIGKLRSGEREKLLGMESYLGKRVVGQDHALHALSAAILESRSGLGKKGQPIGSFFLVGPTGTGKTELAKSIAEFLFNDEKAMIRFDMSEFKEEHSAALLYGAPPGYVGYEEGGLLVNKIRRQPYTVLLFDEIEKAHPSVFDTFLQIMDEGHMHDRLGKEGDFSNALILFTSNIGSEWIAEQFGRGVQPGHTRMMDLLKGHFRPEFLARLSEIVPFAPIGEESVLRIFDIQLKGLREALDRQDIHLDIHPDVRKDLALSGFTPQYGARQLSGVIRTQLRRPISRFIISGELGKGKTVHAEPGENDGGIAWRISENAL